MNSKNSAASVALFLSFNLLFFSIVTATCNCNNPSNPKPTPKPKPTPSTPTTPTPKPKPTPSTPTTPTPKPKPTPSTPTTPTPKPKPTPSTPTTPSSPCTPPSTPSTPSTPTPTPTPSTPSTPTTPTTPAPSSGGKCPRDALKLGVCANLLQLVNVVVGSPSTLPCCTLIQGITDLEAAICLCTAIKANVLGINLNVPVSLTLLLNTCGKKLPSGFQCA